MLELVGVRMLLSFADQALIVHHYCMVSSRGTYVYCFKILCNRNSNNNNNNNNTHIAAIALPPSTTHLQL